MLNLIGMLLLGLPLYVFKVSFFGIPTNVFEVFFLAVFTAWLVIKKIKKEKIFPEYFRENTLFVAGLAVSYLPARRSANRRKAAERPRQPIKHRRKG